jgi:cation transport ATPase
MGQTRSPQCNTGIAVLALAMPMKSASELSSQAQVVDQRRRHRLYMKVSACGLALLGAVLLAPQPWLNWIAGPGVVFVLAGLSVFFTARPACAAQIAASRHKTSAVSVRSAAGTACSAFWQLRNARGALTRWIVARRETTSFTSARRMAAGCSTGVAQALKSSSSSPANAPDQSRMGHSAKARVRSA